MACDVINVSGCIIIFIVGKSAVQIPSKVMMPLIFLLNGCTFMLFPLIENPNTFFSYGVWLLLTFIFLVETITIENFFSRTVPGEIRGIMYAIFFCTGLIGRLICYKTAEILF